MKNEKEKTIELAGSLDGEIDPFGLRGFDFSVRVPEKSEMFDEKDAGIYIEKCDYPMTADDLLLAWEIQQLEIQQLFGPVDIRRMKVLDAMCGPGRLGRELLILGAQHVIFHDGDETMITHARTQALDVMQSGQSIGFVTSDVANINLPDDTFDLIVCHNATHQLLNLDRLGNTMEEFLRITVPSGHIVIADYQRSTAPGFFKALEARLWCTDPDIVPLLIPSFIAAFSKEEFGNVLQSIPGIKKWSVADAKAPKLSEEMQERVDADRNKGHLMDYSPISLRVIVQKE